MEFKELMKYIEENKEDHFAEVIEKNKHAIKENNKKTRRKQIFKTS
ncbi:hypothetical protein KQ3_04832 [Bacillus cereus B5-2]|nr:hypothetical protein KQ3_04832 [Bacillus cereus B5-2]